MADVFFLNQMFPNFVAGDEYGDGGVNGNPSAGPNKVEFLTVQITKGAMGFGFTIADSAYGQKVKTILDRPRCKNLQEGDILVDINGINMRHMSHGEVVQVKKNEFNLFYLLLFLLLFCVLMAG